jgi:rhodanese-related sulfurtransferase
MRNLKCAAVATALFMTPFAIAAESKAPDCSNDALYPEVSKQELTTLVEKKAAFVIDVNSANSFKKTHVPTAIHFEANKDQFATVLPTAKDTPIVAYCGGPKCTAWKEAAREACKLGYTNVRHFKGGISGWNSKS